MNEDMDLAKHLEQYEKQVFEDTAFILSHVMDAKDYLYKGESSKAYDVLDFVWNVLHTRSERTRAEQLSNERVYSGLHN